MTKADANPEQTAEEIYNRIAELLSVSNGQIIHERCFGSVGLEARILNARTRSLLKYRIETNTPVTFVDGTSCLENKFAGIQIRALQNVPQNSIRTILHKGIPKGRTWSLDGSKFLILQSMDSGNLSDTEKPNRKSQSEVMFREAERLLRTEGFSYKDVIRTWIYISDILEWYDDFNTVRNHCYSEYGLIGDNDSKVQVEEISFPASTGIEGKNPSLFPAIMDLFAVHRSPGSTVQIRSLYGTKQRSPFRYGSAFSRAMVLEESDTKLILVSGTASIDEQGKSMFLGDIASQIRQSLNVVSALIAPEGATLDDLCEATVFIKRKEDFPVYQEVIKQMNFSEQPSICVLADVCRDELLFEIDAAFILKKD